MCYNDVQNGALCTKNDITRKDIIIMKTLLALLCTLTMLLTGCSNADSTGTNSGASKADSSAVEQVKSARVTIEGTKFMVDGKELWINGVNTPWQAWNDFCGNMDEAAWEQTFALLKQDNINCTRIWINCNGTGVVRVDENGMVYNINENHWTDLDKLFALAEKYEIYVMPTLTSFDHFKQGNTGANNWRTLISTKEGCDDFAEKYAGEFARRYAQCEYIFGVDIMNEPDWVYENAECGNISWKNLQYFFGKCAEAIHANSDIPVTVGLAMIKYNSDRYDGNFVSDERLKEAVGSDEACLDFYSPHFYMWEKPYWGFPFEMSPEEYGLDGTKPCLIGETSNDDESQSGVSCPDKYKSAYENGWCGVMVWMEYRTDGSSGCDELWYRYDLTREATNAMAQLIPEKIHPLDA